MVHSQHFEGGPWKDKVVEILSGEPEPLIKVPEGEEGAGFQYRLLRAHKVADKTVSATYVPVAEQFWLGPTLTR